MALHRHRAVLSVLLAALVAPGAASSGAFAAAAPLPPAAAEDRPAGQRSRGPDVSTELEEALDRGLAWLADQQFPDGSFGTVPEGASDKRNTADAKTAVTALATLAFLGGGHGLRKGPYARTVQRAVHWLLEAQNSDPESPEYGYVSFTGDGTSKMHGHGFATLALAEAFGTAAAVVENQDTSRRHARDTALAQRLRVAIQAAVDCIERSQSSSGGWGYLPTQGGTSFHEGSVTVCQVQALLAASNRGFRVSMPRIEEARTYMRKSQAASGGFKYKLRDAEPLAGVRSDAESYALTAAGIVSLLGLAEYDRRSAIEAGFRYLARKEEGGIPRRSGTPYYFYGAFYAVQAYHFEGGERWDQFWHVMRREILGSQQGDGSWSGHDTRNDLGNVYPTALSLLMLEVPVRVLSIFER